MCLSGDDCDVNLGSGGLGLCDKLGGKPNAGGPNASLGKTRDKSRQIGFATKRNVSGGVHKLY